MQTVRFKPRVSLKHTAVFFISSAVFLLFGIVLLVANYTQSPPPPPSDLKAAWFIACFPAFLLALLILQLFPIHTWYEVNQNGIRLQRLYLRKEIPWSDLKETRIAKASEVQDELKKFQETVYKEYSEMDIAGTFKAQITMGKAIQYCTVPILFSETRVGSPTNITQFGTKTSGSFLIIGTKRGELLVISPIEVEKMKKVIDGR